MALFTPLPMSVPGARVGGVGPLPDGGRLRFEGRVPVGSAQVETDAVAGREWPDAEVSLTAVFTCPVVRQVPGGR
ncbi:hypothetical protein ADL02_22545 [Streptomyces sp. NRRL WC-3723]|nr:hypothetical protein ADL02_22545 [Streptomyces sp. NRRL WC-3723]